MLLFAAKSSLILGLAWLITKVMRRSSAASRHVVWSCALLAVLLLPLTSWLVPSLYVPWLAPPSAAETLAAYAPHMPELQVFPALPAGQNPDPQPSTPLRRQAVAPRGASGAPGVGPLIAAGLTIGWAIGSLTLLVRLAVGFVTRARLTRVSTVLGESPLRRVTTSYVRAMRIARPVRVRIAPTEMMPATWGLIRPTVLLPPSAHHWREDRLRLVFVHELSHVVRFDVLTAAIAYLATVLVWWNPLVWIATRHAQLERERACDDAVLRSGLTPSRYANELLALAQSLPSPFAQRLALAMAKPHRVERRLVAILDANQRRAGTSHTVAVIASVLMALQLPLAAITTEPPTPAPAFEQSSPAISLSAVTPHTADVIPAARSGADQQPPASVPRPTPATTPATVVPDLSGPWSLDPVPAALDLATAPFGLAFTAIQNDKALVADITPTRADVSPYTLRFLFNGLPSNLSGGGTAIFPSAAGRRTPDTRSSYTVRDNTHWDGNVLEIRTTETSNNQEHVTRIRRLRRDGDALTVETTVWTDAQPRVVTARYQRPDDVAAGPPNLRRRPMPIPSGQFGAGAYLAEDVSTLVPPVPIQRVHPQFTPEALRAKIEGVVEMEAIVGIDGRVSDARVIRSLDTEYGLDAQALAAAMASRYAPATLDGHPVRCRIVVESRFTIR